MRHLTIIIFFTSIFFNLVTAQEKIAYEIDSFFDVELYRLKYEDFRKKFSKSRLPKNPTDGWPRPKSNSKLFPFTKQVSTRSNSLGLQYLTLEFKPENFTQREFKELRTTVARTILKHFPCKFTTTYRSDGSSLSLGSSSTGLQIHMEYFCPNSVNYKYLAYLKIKVSDKSEKITHEYHDISFKDEYLRAFANYIEATAYTPLTADEVAKLKNDIAQLKRKNHLLPKPTKVFYTDIFENKPYFIEFGEHGYPSIKNYIGLKKPNKPIYHRWTVADGAINCIDLVQVIDGKESISPLLKVWFEQGSFVLSEQKLDNKGLSHFIVSDYYRGSIKRQISLLHKSNQYKITSSTFHENACNYTFNERGRLTAGILLSQHRKFRYTEEAQFKEASFKSANEYIYSCYYMPYSRLHNQLKLSNVFSKRNLHDYWKLPRFKIPNQNTVGKGIPEYINSNKWVLAYRNNQQKTPSPKPNDFKYIEAKRTPTKPAISNTTPKPVISKTTRESTTREQLSHLSDFIQKAGNNNLFTLTKSNFQKKHQSSLRANWTDKFNRSARSTTSLDFFKVKSRETIFSFRADKLSKLTMMIYNKGDHEALSESSFQRVQNAVILAVQNITGAKPNYKPNAGIAKNHLHWWLTEKYLIKLESNYIKSKKAFSSEYIRLTFTPAMKGMSAVNIDKLSTDILSNQELVGLVSKDKDGAIYISGIPMVDQGKKGYCACAATARILNYYGRDIDQHDIAKLAMTSSMGTQPEDLQKALKNISAKLRLNFSTLVKCYLGNDRDIKRFVKKLQSAYKKHDYNFNIRNLKINELKPVFADMALNDARYKDFKRGIIRSINLGRPLAWALYLGIVPEPEIPQASGGHMRLIIGYNEVTEEIYYSDTWGAGHEKKTMDMISAFWVSAALWEIRPR
jgi:hypothetical protein